MTSDDTREQPMPHITPLPSQQCERQPAQVSSWSVQKDVTPLVVDDVFAIGWRPVPTDVVRRAYYTLLDVALHMAGSAKQLADDVKARSALGVQRYGTPLRTFNGREARVDMYQEILDALQYGRQELEERDERRRVSERQ